MIINRANFAFVHDVLMAAAAFILSLFLRLGENIIYYPREELFLAVLIFICSTTKSGYFNSLVWKKPVVINPLESIET